MEKIVEKVASKEKTVEKVTPEVPVAINGNNIPKEAKKAEDKVLLFTEKQSQIIMPKIEERRYFQSRVKDFLKQEGELIALVIDAANINADKVVNAKLNEEGTGIIVSVIE